MSVPQGTLKEEIWNSQLAKVIRSSHAPWHGKEEWVWAERTDKNESGTGNERIDVRIRAPDEPEIVIETAYGGDRDRDALARLNASTNLETAISIAIPTYFKTESEESTYRLLSEGTQIEYALLQKDSGEHSGIARLPARGYIKGSVRELTALIRSVTIPPSKVRAVSEQVAKLVYAAADCLEDGLSKHDAGILAKQMSLFSEHAGLRTIAILWLDALLVQAHLRECDTLIDGVIVDAVPFDPKKIDLTSVKHTWDRIIDLNWRAIFRPAVQALEEAGNRAFSATKRALEYLVDAAHLIQGNHLSRHTHIGGEIFPKVIADQSEVAAFYTTPWIAEFLAAMTIRDSDRDWGNLASLYPLMENDEDGTLQQSHGLVFGDLACGTGTLIRAAYTRIKAAL